MKNTVNAADTLCRLAKRFAVGKCLKACLLGAVILGASPAFAGDPCKMVLCMFGKYSKTTGSGDDGGDECDSAEAEYFGILVYKKKKIDWTKTAKERLSRQNSCPTADRGKTKQINDKFGKSLG